MFHPKGNNLLLEPVQEADQSKGGIWIPDRAKNVMNQGKVLELGPDVPEGVVKVGEMVVFTMHVEYRIQIDNKWFIVVNVNDVLCGDNCESIPKDDPNQGTLSLPMEDRPKRKAPIGLQ